MRNVVEAITISAPRPTEALEILELRRDIFREQTVEQGVPAAYTARQPLTVFDEVQVKGYGEYLARAAGDPTRYHRVVRATGQVRGILFANLYPDHAYLNLLLLAPEIRNFGIGSRLLADFEAALLPPVPITLAVARGNTAARRFYSRHGFEEAGFQAMVKYRKEAKVL